MTDAAIPGAPSIVLCDAWSTPGDPEVVARRADVLDVAGREADVPRWARRQPLDALVCLHRFSPKRPTLPDELEWAVALVAGGLQARVVRLEFTMLTSRASVPFDGLGLAAPASVHASSWPSTPRS